jgi:serine/threonine-protein kinase
MVMVELDTAGRLQRLSAVPPERSESPASSPKVDWGPLFAAAGHDIGDFTEVDPVWVPEQFADRRRAWTGTYPNAPETEIRVEAGAYAGSPVFFRIVEPWTRPLRQEHPHEAAGARTIRLVTSGFPFVALVGGCLLAWRNVRLGRGDRKRALRLALYFFGFRMVVWLLATDDLFEPTWVDTFFNHLTWALYRLVVVWVFYLALEPYLRRIWPRTMVSWVRLLDGRWRDPLVGRDVLLGCVSVTALGLVLQPVQAIGQWLAVEYWQGAYEAESAFALEALRGVAPALASMLMVHLNYLLRWVLFGVVWLLLLRLVLRRTWLAAAVWLLSFSLVNVGVNPSIWPVVVAICQAWWLIVFFRVGLLPLAVGASIAGLYEPLLPTLDPSRWYAGSTYLFLAIAFAIAAYGFYVSLAGRPLLRDEFLEG